MLSLGHQGPAVDLPDPTRPSPGIYLSQCFLSCSQISRTISVFIHCKWGLMDPDVSSTMHTLLSKMVPNSLRLPAPWWVVEAGKG